MSLQTLHGTWPQAARRLLEGGESAVVRVLVAEVNGSAPREAGTCMLVTRDAKHGTNLYGTIGGGHLELQATHMAEALLEDAGQSPRSVEVRELVLGRELAQCCGGVVRLWVERFTHEDLALLRQVGCVGSHVAIVTSVSKQGNVLRRLLCEATPPQLRLASICDGEVTLVEPLEKQPPALWLFGAGHVGHALVHILADLPFEVTWIDSRQELFSAPIPDNVRPLCSKQPVSTVSAAPPGALFLVMTHDHSLDYELCRNILQRTDFDWLGLIGSKSKAARFRSRLGRAGLTREQIGRLTCPIGIEGVSSKLPAAIAVAVAAQLLRGVTSSVASLRPPLEAANADCASSAAIGADGCSGVDCETCASRAVAAGVLNP
jgi:xanthine dehydrogenase accessory factor